MATHTYALLAVSKATYDEIKAKLVAAGYEHAITGIAALRQSGRCTGAEVIDMHGLALHEEQG